MSTTSGADRPVPLIVSFPVQGLPKAKGSLTRFPNGYVETAGPALDVWMDAVTTAAREERSKLGRTMTKPLRLDVMVRLPMPKRRPARVRALALQGVPYPHTGYPDGDKLLRAIGDALTRSGLITDDRHIFDWRLAKYEVIGWVGAEIDVWEMT